MSQPTFISPPDVTNTNSKIIGSIGTMNDIQNILSNQISQTQLAAGAAQTAGLSDEKARLDTITAQLGFGLNNSQSLVGNLYNQADLANISFSNDITAAQQLITNANTANDIINSETNLSNERLKNIREEKNNKLRLAQINTYYSKKYGAQSEIMKIIIVSCVIILILWYIKSSELLPLPSILFTILISLMVAISSIIIFFKAYYISIRDDNDFDQYNFEIKSSNLPPLIVPTGLNLGDTGSTFTNTNINCVTDPLLCCPKGYSFENNYCKIIGDIPSL